ncbi:MULTISPECIES: phosphoethanolamine transferase CptA [unclassified Brenneria]|uniref:phosphoethanolamine transferase CptA n=1 Tax=unclassified Brenneria TaxID=2634434 RepID=UPI0029C410F5|nr:MULTISPECIES: phosphoethanolamine transferase CptA [unclassified Brenneria]MDX5628325.1 phosphoethanolamine transferase CptA [Brenneria sp. L3-3Z]MDX5695492.1 phosphoethanolamine transferase CptA [Brenneria sp. L4-2C]MEE3662345.1 phosphoethanolamine transferase CptA [Brenneria sp. g21c3]
MSDFLMKKRFSWGALGWLLLFFWYFSAVLQLSILLSGHSGFNGLRDALIYSLFWLVPVFIFPRQTRIITAVLGIVLWASSVVALGYYSIYKQEFSQSILFVMFESNTTEAGEYMSQYFSLKVVGVLLVYTVAAFFLWTKVRPVYLPIGRRAVAILVIITALFGIPAYKNIIVEKGSLQDTVSYLADRMATTAPWQFMSSYMEYRQQLNSMEAMLQQNAALPPLANLKDANGDTPRTLVLVIGESTTSSRMSLYGYPRPTTPRLDALSQSDPNLVVFKDVVTSRPYTIEILQQALTFADEQNPEVYLTKPSLMNLMKQAGYKTFWITNQQTMTKRNTMLTVFSQQTDKQFYLNNQRTQSARQYDDVVLPPFEEVMADPAQKKFIVVHLLGTHMNYKYRYPEDFDRFNDRTGVPSGVSDKDVDVYNHYDNAQLYNDYIVSSLINTFAQHKPNGFLLYFSDHGEDVYETPPHNILGRNEAAPTRAMYTIPFMVWMSPEWRASHSLDYTPYIARKYSNAHLIHTWSDLAGLSYNFYEPSKSLVNPAFKQTERWIGNPYDKKALRPFDDLPTTVK